MSNLDAPCTETPVTNSLLGDSLFPIFNPYCFLLSTPCSIKKWFIIEGWYKIGHFWEQNQFNRPQMVQFECPWPWVTNPLVLFTFEEFPFPIFCPCSSLPSFLTLQYKEMVYYGRLGKKVDFFWNKISLTGWKWSSLKAPGSYNPW